MSDATPPARRPLRSETRKAKKRSAKHEGKGSKIGNIYRKHRVLTIAGSILLVAALLFGGLYGYTYWRISNFPKVTVKGLTPRPANGPFNVLIVGSDSRAFAGDSGSNAQQYGASSSVGGQRSDVTIVARVNPATHSVRLLSIPRDTYVKIPGTIANVSGYNRINTAFDNGPALLVSTIQQNFHIPISDYIALDFEGLTTMVDAIGGVYLNFRSPVRDIDSPLGVTKTGCHLVLGAQAVALVRSRHLYYKSNGIWTYDGYSDWSRIQRQDAFFRALIPRLKGIATNPIGMNSFLGAAQSNITIDQSLSVGTILSLANTFRQVSAKSLTTETLPTAPVTINGEAVLEPAPQQDAALITSFLAFGTTTAAYHLPVAGDRGIADALLTSAPATQSGGGVTVTTLPGLQAPPASQVVTNTQPEPWNPVPCSG